MILHSVPMMSSPKYKSDRLGVQFLSHVAKLPLFAQSLTTSIRSEASNAGPQICPHTLHAPTSLTGSESGIAPSSDRGCWVLTVVDTCCVLVVPTCALCLLASVLHTELLVPGCKHHHNPGFCEGVMLRSISVAHRPV